MNAGSGEFQLVLANGGELFEQPPFIDSFIDSGPSDCLHPLHLQGKNDSAASYPALSFCKDMRTDFLPHPCSGRVRDVPVPDSERELKSLKISLKIFPRLQ